MSYRKVLCLSAAAFALSACASSPPQMAEPEVSEIAPVVTPLDVTLEPLGKAQGYDLSAVTAAAFARDEIVYANQQGLTLYTSDHDPVGRTLCVDECTETFKPFLASDQSSANMGGETFGRWTTIDREDGTRQWALNGKALYTYVKDVDPGSIRGDSPAMRGAPRLNGAGVKVGGGNRGDFDGEIKIDPMPDGWTAAMLFPFNGVKVPPGFSIKEVPDAAAFAIVDARGHTGVRLRR